MSMKVKYLKGPPYDDLKASISGGFIIFFCHYFYFSIFTMNFGTYKMIRKISRSYLTGGKLLRRSFFTHFFRTSENKNNSFATENASIKDLLDSSVVVEENKRVSEEQKRRRIVLLLCQIQQGMGKKLLHYPNVIDMYERASEILGYDILQISIDGPESQLTQTSYQQPAILLASLAAVEKLREEDLEAVAMCEATAGFSVGEIAALTFAGSITFENAVQLVKIRAEAMQIASELHRSGMMTVFYGPESKLSYACSVAKRYCETIGMEDVDCRVANYLFPHCKVIAGNEEALEFILKHKDDFKLKRFKRIDVSGAFHTDLMKPAAFAFQEALKNVSITHPQIPVISNVTGAPFKNVTDIKKQLSKQIYSPVRWEQTVHRIYERKENKPYPRTFECGPGKSLCSILKMVNAKAHKFCYNVEV
ncbi:putative malonyl-CoA-acyl carrier protein transacylase, mitochondrial [Armadillidium vulgare]|nr:putative malonyl-CoA-acyl carrier protein transacylase, mitochondrial [Armadillidium vulgare]